MGRPARLTIGELLLGIAALLFALRDQAVDKDLLARLIPIFMAPGILFFAWGLLPGRSLSEDTRMVFSPTRLLAGLAAFAGGVAVAYVGRRFDLPSPVLVGGMLMVPVGLLYSATCWGQGCRNCGVLLEEFRARFNSSDAELLVAAVGVSSVSEILALHRSVPGPSRVRLLVRYCPRCQRAGLLTGPGNTRSALRPDQVKALLAGLVKSLQPDEVKSHPF